MVFPWEFVAAVIRTDGGGETDAFGGKASFPAGTTLAARASDTEVALFTFAAAVLV